jgi:hypothetical protein
MDLANSTLVKNLEDGKLPDVNVTIDNTTLIELVVAIVVSGLAIILLWKFLR